MDTRLWRLYLARFLALIAIGCSLVGADAAILEKEWELGVATWFVAAAVVALLAIFLELDQRAAP